MGDFSKDWGLVSAYWSFHASGLVEQAPVFFVISRQGVNAARVLWLL